MDNLDHSVPVADSVDASQALDIAISGIKNIQQKSILKKAKSKIDSGNLSSLSGREIQVALDNGVPYTVFDGIPGIENHATYQKYKIADLKYKAEVAGLTKAEADKVVTEGVAAEAGTSPMMIKLKQYLPYILGAAALLLLFYFIRKR